MSDLAKVPQYRLPAAKTAHEADGRKHRSQKSQARIVNAMLELVAEGNLEPSADQIADIAKIKMKDLNARTEDAAFRIIAGTARQMGIDIEA